jgi:hypothetical protein
MTTFHELCEREAVTPREQDALAWKLAQSRAWDLYTRLRPAMRPVSNAWPGRRRKP